MQICLQVNSACICVSAGKWKTVAEVSAAETTASVSLFSLRSQAQYVFRVFAVNARGLGHASQVSDSLLMAGEPPLI